MENNQRSSVETDTEMAPESETVIFNIKLTILTHWYATY